jgi:hypothetical protein
VLTLDQGFTGECMDAGTLFTAVDVDAAILRNGAVARVAEWRARVAG